MVQALAEVLRELWEFVSSSLRRRSGSFRSAGGRAVSRQEIRGPTLHYSDTKAGARFAMCGYITKDTTSCYQDADVHSRAVTTFVYGETVQTMVSPAPFSFVQRGEVQGWVRTSDLTIDENTVFPQFQNAVVYSGGHPETKKLRRCLNPILKNVPKGPLTEVEFVLYRLWRRQVVVPWVHLGDLSSTMTWTVRLAGVRSVACFDKPSTNAVIQYVTGDLVRYGYLAAVHPDCSFRMESVGRLKPGEYLEETFTRSEFENWRAIFITFS